MRLARRVVLSVWLLGCSEATEAGGDEEVAVAEAASTAASMHSVLADRNLSGDQEVSVAEVQAFLEEQGSALASYSEGGRKAARIIVEESRAEHISPIFVLARIQGESGLVTSGTLDGIESATGCGCPDWQACDPSLANFGPQVRCTAEQFRIYLDDLRDNGATISGWSVGEGKWTLDGCWVIPQNAATAALYTYTPWVGATATEWCGDTSTGGTSLIGDIYRDFAAVFEAGGGGGSSACEFGDGLYCVGDTLKRCSAGTMSVVKQCANGCFVAPPGQDDRCK
jgi:hypothetical protein